MRNKLSALIIMFILSAIMLIGLAGCNGRSSGSQHAKKVIAEIKASPTQPVEPLPVIKPVSKVTYQAHHLRNPFTRPQQAKKVGQHPDMQRSKEPLELFPLDSLKMAGTIVQDNKVWALVIAPDGAVYPVTLGNRIGKHFGKIVKIMPDEIELMESVQVGGEWQKHKATLGMSKEGT